MSDPVPGDTAKPESKEQFPSLCVLCGNIILEDEQEHGISAAGARYHVDCVVFEAEKEQQQTRDERKGELAEKAATPGNALPDQPERPPRPDGEMPQRPVRPGNELPDQPEKPQKPEGDRPFLGDKPGPG